MTASRSHTLATVRQDARAMIHPQCDVIETTHEGRRVYIVKHPHKAAWTLDSGHAALLISASLEALATRIREIYC